MCIFTSFICYPHKYLQMCVKHTQNKQKANQSNEIEATIMSDFDIFYSCRGPYIKYEEVTLYIPSFSNALLIVYIIRV